MRITGPGLSIVAERVASDASARRARGQSEALLSGHASLARLVVNGTVVAVEGQRQIPLGALGTPYINQVARNGDEIAARALLLDLAVGQDIAIAESLAGAIRP